MTKKRSYWIIGLVVLGITALVGLQKAGLLGNDHTMKVAAEEASLHDIIESVSASGKIYPVSEVKISPDVSGEITDLFVEEGDSVFKGEVLANINASIYQSMVNRAEAQLNQTRSAVSNANALTLQAKAQLDQASATYARNRDLFEDKVISAVEFESAETAYKTAQANYKAAMETIRGNEFGVASAEANVTEAIQTLKKTTIYAPMGGIVSKLFVKQGERVVGTAQMAGTEILRVADMSKMKVDVEVGENDIQKVKPGDTANIEVEAYPSKTFKGLVVSVSQSSTATGLQQSFSSLTDQVTNYTVSIELLRESYTNLLEIDRRHFPFRPGMSASVEILTKHQLQVLAVPINAVTTRENESDSEEKTGHREVLKEYVFCVDKQNKVVMKEVKTGVQDNEYIQILSGLNEGDRVITAPFGAISRTLKKEMKVKVVPKKE
ncbi:MAG TPA: efflux RND transporter periplasmic adaptor subunit, partial [Chitinophagaceae bacterium]|nr:efflux RND transporter periplasmic adaptor subunit [Chitinophagaceae bacterium]